jgi:hypothetical protein
MDGMDGVDEMDETDEMTHSLSERQSACPSSNAVPATQSLATICHLPSDVLHFPPLRSLTLEAPE